MLLLHFAYSLWVNLTQIIIQDARKGSELLTNALRNMKAVNKETLRSRFWCSDGLV